MKDPIILYPHITPEDVWNDCRKWVDSHGGLTGLGGEPNWMAAAGADPGVCSCPACHEYHWSHGTIHQCPTCGFVYPSDWWPMFSWGCQAGRTDRQHANRQLHPYWAYGFRLKASDPWGAKDKIDWRKEIGDCYIAGGELHPARDLQSECRPKQLSHDE